jgi:hypothetical protein
MKQWELVARECIRDSLARYTWSGDALHLEELARAFCPDGVLEVRGHEPVRGRDEIVAFLGGVVALGAGPTGPAPSTRRVVRHNLANTRFVELEPDRALVESYFTVLTEVGLDHFGRYRDTFVPVGDQWLIRHRFVSTDWHA